MVRMRCHHRSEWSYIWPICDDSVSNVTSLMTMANHDMYVMCRLHAE